MCMLKSLYPSDSLTCAFIHDSSESPNNRHEQSARQRTLLPVSWAETETCRRSDGSKMESGLGRDSALRFSWTPRIPPVPFAESRSSRSREMVRGVKLEPWLSRVGFCFSANYCWLLALVPSPIPPSCSVFLPSSLYPALSCCSLLEKVLLMTEEGYPIYLQAKPFRPSSPHVPADPGLLKREK